MNGIHRRQWLQQCALAMGGLALPAIGTAAPAPPFAPGEKKGPIRLSSNENPYGPAPKARAALQEAITASNRYAFFTTDDFKTQLGRHLGVGADAIKLTAGSSEMLGIIALYWAFRKGSGLTCVPTFDICFRQAERWGLRFRQLPLGKDRGFDLGALSRNLAPKQLVYICNPNNPTGTFIPQQELLAFHRQMPEDSLLLVDEAYLDYAGAESLAPHTAQHRNLVVVRTFSKAHGLAGARIGYGVGHPSLIAELADFQAWNNATLSVSALRAAAASLEDTDFLSRSVQVNREQRERTAAALRGLGLQVLPSETNFLHAGGVPADWAARMEAAGILVGRATEDTLRWSRITIGTPEEMDAFIAAARTILKK